LAQIYTIGHSNRPLQEFIRLLIQVPVNMVVDVRTIPKSRHNPQFDAGPLAHSLRHASIAYRHIPELGGLRSARRDKGPSPNGFWENDSFRNYADYAATPQFREGLMELRNLARSHICAVMCAEAVWWRCHRRIIADYLVAAGENVFHIMGEGKLEPAFMTKGAVTSPDGVITYPAAQGGLAL
jgi:uncharacterized protein (DUF488 family)